MSPLFAKERESDWFLPGDVRDQLTETFKSLKKPVVLEFFSRSGTNDEFAEYTKKFCVDLARLAELITVREFDTDSDRARELGVDASPSVCVNPDEYHIRFLGAPLGEEGKAFITAIMLVSLGMSGLSDASDTILDTLSEERLAQVFVSPT